MLIDYLDLRPQIDTTSSKFQKNTTFGKIPTFRDSTTLDGGIGLRYPTSPELSSDHLEHTLWSFGIFPNLFDEDIDVQSGRP